MKLKDYESKLRKLREERDSFLGLMHSIDKRLARGEITRYQKQFTINSITHGLQEHEYLRALERDIAENEASLKNEQKHSPEFKNIMIISASIIIAILILILLIIPGIIKASDQKAKTFTIPVDKTFNAGESSTIPLNMDPQGQLTSIRINGTYIGDVKVYLVVNNTLAKYIVFDSETYDKDIVSVTGNVIAIRGTPGPLGTSLINVCEETCKLKIVSSPEQDIANAYISIEIGKSSRLDIDSIVYTQVLENNPPKQLKKIKDIVINTTNISVDMNGYFTDEDEDVLSYALSNIPGITGNTKDNKVTFKVPSGVNAVYSGFIYVSDSKETINSNVFRIIVNTTEAAVPKDQSNRSPEINNTDHDDESQVSIKTNNTIEMTTNLTNITTTENKSALSNRTINMTVNKSEDGTVPGGVAPSRIVTYNQFNFGVDNKLKAIWDANASATPRIIVRYKKINNQTSYEYIEGLSNELEIQKDLYPEDFDLEKLAIRKAQIQKQLYGGIIPSGSEKSGSKLDFFTGNVVDDLSGLDTGNVGNNTEQITKDDLASPPIDSDALNAELAQIEKKIMIAEVYHNIEHHHIPRMIRYDNNSRMEIIEANLSEIRTLRFSTSIDRVYLDQPIEPLITSSMNITRIPEAKLLSTGTLDGTNVTICVLDSGINTEYVKNPSRGYNFVGDNGNYSDDNGHGTATAYVIYSIVPKAALVVGKVLDENSHGYESSVISGLYYCRDEGASIVSLSLGSGGYDGYCNDNPLAQTVNELNVSGMTIIAASGNNASELVKVPACARGAIAVGGSTKNDSLAGFTSYNGNTLLLAPSVNIRTINANGDTVAASGTSMAVPFVAAIIAMLKQHNESLNTSTSIKDIIIHTGQVVTATNRTFSRVDALNALTYNVTNNLTEAGINGAGSGGNVTGQYSCSYYNYDQYGCQNMPCCSWNGWGSCGPRSDPGYQPACLYCSYYDADWSNIPDGYIADGYGYYTTPSASYQSCGATDGTCTEGACWFTRYYHSCDGSGSCHYDTTNAGSGTIYAASGYSINSGCSSWGSTQCSGTDHCYGTTYYSGYMCNGAGTCNVHDGATGADYDSNACSCYGYTDAWNLGGEGTGAGSCCGDDASEYSATTYRFEYDLDRTQFSWDSDGNDHACCDTSSDCVYNDVCTAINTNVDLNSDSKYDARCILRLSQGAWINVDYHSSYCSASGYTWNVGYAETSQDTGYLATYAGGGDTNYCKIQKDTYGGGWTSTKNCCCGDDAGEYTRTVGQHNGGGTIAWAGSQTSCCDGSNDLINYNSACVSAQGYGGSVPATGYTGNDMYAYPYDDGWLECDYYAGDWCNPLCNGVYTSGEAVGEFTAQGQSGCCGDDNGENRKYRYWYSYNNGDQVGGTMATDSNDKACCNSASDCVYNSVCYSAGSWYNLGSAGWAHCNGADGWLNADRHLTYCDATAGAGHWNIGGNADVDDSPDYYTPAYDANYCGIGAAGNPSQQCCCGDDPGENYRSTGGYIACCDTSNDCVTATKGCVDSGGTGNGPFADGTDYCNGGSWIDCSTDSQCDTGYYCNANTCTALNTPTLTATAQTDKPLNSRLGRNYVTWNDVRPAGYQYNMDWAGTLSLYDGTGLAYSHDNLNDNTQYCYYVRVEKPDGTHYGSFSSQSCPTTYDRTGPSQPALTLTPNNAGNYMDASWTSTGSYYSLERGTSAAGQYVPTGGLPGVYDDFSDGDYTSNPSWTLQGGSWSVSSAQLAGPGAGEYVAVAGDASWGNYKVEMDFKIASGTHASIIFRSPNINQFYQLEYYGGTNENNGGNINLYKYNSGYSYIAAANVGDLSYNTWYHATVVALNSNFYVYLNDVLVMSTSDASYGSGKAGVGVHDASVVFDNYKVTPIQASASLGDGTATDTTGPATPGAPTASAASSTSIQISWAGVTDNGNTYYYYPTAYDASWNEDSYYGGIYWGPYTCTPSNYNCPGTSTTVDASWTNGESYVVEFYGMLDSTADANNNWVACYLWDTDWSPACAAPLYAADATANTWYKRSCVTTGDGTSTQLIVGCYFGDSGTTAGNAYVKGLKVHKISSATVTTGTKDYYVTGTGTGINTWSASNPQTATGLNCFSSYTYTVTARDNGNTAGSASSASSAVYPISSVAGCGAAGPSGYCASSGTCYYTGAGCPSASCAGGSSACNDDGLVSGGNCYYDESCGAGGYVAPTSRSCANGTASCTDDGVENAGTCYYNEACTGTGYVISSNSCSAGTAACTDDGYVSGTTCYYDEACTGSGYTAPSTATCLASGCNADGVVSSNTCYWNEACGTTGRTVSSSACNTYGTTSCTDDGVDNGAGSCVYDEACNGTGLFASTASCASGTSSCSDDGYASGTTCYYDEACTGTGYTAPATATCISSGCLADGVISSNICYWDEACTASGRVQTNATLPTCTSGSFIDNAGAACFTSSGNICYSAASDPCTGTGASYTTTDLDASFTYASITDGAASYRLNDTTDTCYYTTDPCTTSGANFPSSASCLHSGTVSGGSCYYDVSGTGGDRSNDCSGTGCTGIASQAAPTTCGAGSWADGAGYCWQTTSTNCYYNSTDLCGANTNGWDYGNATTACAQGTTTCCAAGNYYEGVSCTSSGASNPTYDRDTTQARCIYSTGGCTAFNWSIGGEVAEAACCGDDASEYTRVETTYSRAIAWDNDEDACCNAANDNVNGSSCYAAYGGYNIAGEISNLNAGGNDTKAFSYSTGWLDCDQADFMDYWCGTMCGPGLGSIAPRNGSVGNESWNAKYAGESGVGEYANMVTLECCGDDAYENYRSRVAAANMDNGYATLTSDDACCNAATDCIDDQLCFSSGDTTRDADGNGDNDYCNAGTWNDCNTNAECGTGFVCSSGECIAAGCRDLSTPNEVITLTNNVNSTGTCFSVNAPNVTIDCAGYIINYSTAGAANTYGINTTQKNTTIKNCRIYDGNMASVNSARYGIYFNTNDDSAIYNSFVSVGNSIAVYVASGANNNNITNNTILSASSVALYIYQNSNNNTLIRNNGTTQGSATGIAVYQSSGTTLKYNYGQGGSSRGIGVTSGDNNILISNTAYSVADIGLYIGSSNNNTVTANNGTSGGNLYGIQFDTSSNNTITGNNGTSSGNAYGFYLLSSSYNNLTNNIAVTNTGSGALALSSSPYNNITNQRANSGGYGLSLSASSNCILNNNSVSATNIALRIVSSSDNTVLNNVNATSTSSYGIDIENAYNITATNTIGASGSSNGFYVTSSSNNTFNNITATSSTNTAMMLSSGNNIVNNSVITAVNTQALYLTGSSNNRFQSTTSGASSNIGVYLSASSNNNTFRNVTATSTTSTGAYIFQSSGNIMTASNIKGNQSSTGALIISTTSENNTIANSSINGLGNSVAAVLTLAKSNSLINNTILNASTLLSIDAGSGYGMFYWNNFTNGTKYIDNANSTNMFNTSVGGVAQGNKYALIETKKVYDSDNNNWADFGTEYPISSATWSAKWTGSGADYGPWTLNKSINCGATLAANSINNLSDNVTAAGTCFTISNANVTINCAGNTITYSTAGGAGTYAITSSARNTTIINCRIIDGNFTSTQATRYGIYLSSSTYSTIRNNFINTSYGHGIYVYNGANNNNIEYNRIYTSGNAAGGITLQQTSQGNNITKNNITADNYIGIYLNSVSNNVVDGNNATGISIYGIYAVGSNDTIKNNLVYGGNTAIWTGSDNCSMTNNTVSGNYGIILGSGDNSITLNRINTSSTALSISAGNNNNITNNTLITYAGNTDALIIGTGVSGTMIYWNNFTAGGTGRFINAGNISNMLNISVGGHPEGNIYYAINTRKVYDTDNNNWADFGSEYPLNSTTWSAKFYGNLTDFGPWTTNKTIICGSTLNANTVYTLIDNLTSSGTCFNITNANVTLDCAGNTITYSTAGSADTYGVISTAVNTTIKNCKINDGNLGANQFSRYAIYLDSSDNATITNNSLTANYTFLIYLDYSDFAKITNNNITPMISSDGIRMYYGLYNNLSNNIISGASGSQGIDVQTGSTNNNITNNTISTQDGFGIYLTASSNSIQNNNINSETTSPVYSAIYTLGSSHNTILQNQLKAGMASAISFTSASVNNTIANNSFNSTSATSAFIDSTSGMNRLYWNNFTVTSAYFINNSNLTNMFNTSVGGVAQGNIYAGIETKNMADANSDTWGDSGSEYPINATTWPSKWTGSGSDFGPWTTKASTCDYPTSPNVDWNVNGEAMCSNVYISLVNSSVNVNAGDTLILQNATLQLNVTANYQDQITVSNGGILQANESRIIHGGGNFYVYLDVANGTLNMTKSNASSSGSNYLWTRQYNQGKIYLMNSSLYGYYNMYLNQRANVDIRNFRLATLQTLNVTSTTTDFELILNNSLINSIYSLTITDANATFVNANLGTYIYITNNNTYNVNIINSTLGQLYYYNYIPGLDRINITNWRAPIYNWNYEINTSGKHSLILKNSNVTSLFHAYTYNPVNIANSSLYYFDASSGPDWINNSIITYRSNIYSTANEIYTNTSIATSSYIRIYQNSVMNFTQPAQSNYITQLYPYNAGTRTMHGYFNVSSINTWPAGANVNRFFPINLTDSDGIPIPGATIMLKDGSDVTKSTGVTGADGIAIVNVSDDDNTTQYKIYLGNEYKQNITMLYPTAPAGIQIGVEKPVVSSVNLTPETAYLTPEAAYTDDDLIANVTCTDSVFSPLMVYWRVFRNDVYQAAESSNRTITQGVSVNVKNITQASTAVGQNWTIEFTCQNNYTNSTPVNTTTIIILAPPVPTLQSPTNANTSIRTRQPVFTWDNSDSATWYEINITSNNCVGYFGNSTVLIGPSQSNYTPASELCVQTEGGSNTYYNWTVKACNNEACSNWTTKWNFTVESYLSVTLTNSIIQFPSMIPGNQSNTTNLTITPFTFRNDGNVLANMTNLTINPSLWSASGAGLGTKYLKIQAAEKETGSFNTTLSTITWTNASAVNNNTIRMLKYNDTTDEAYIHVLIEAPLQESPGTKTTNMTFNWISI